jgi:hypothetical protein
MINTAKDEVTHLQTKGSAVDTIAAVDKLMDLTKAFDAYAEEILPSRRSSRRSKSFVSNNAASPVCRGVPPERQRSSSTLSQPRGRLFPNSVRTNLREYGNQNNSSSSTVPTNSSEHPIIIPSSMSDTSSRFEEIVASRPSQKNPNTPKVKAGMSFERPHMRTREYINNPDGDILSPPIVKPDNRYTKKRKIGRHTIMLNFASFYLNENFLKVVGPDSYELANMFFSALIKHNDKLDELDQILSDRDRVSSNYKWNGIPGWEITSNGVYRLPGTCGTHHT